MIEYLMLKAVAGFFFDLGKFALYFVGTIYLFKILSLPVESERAPIWVKFIFVFLLIGLTCGIIWLMFTSITKGKS